ncbi:hypothetical protein AVEN_117803-1 [Araneus ventricosus]|uniref:Transposase Tc1-like domain-containing protein n=1 Tax=Araneus ventricosus TaxID=182803 RepID=A0A4Y2B7P2_ARAVE|nr:hypothetical protein AVEN_117803-1 [Araneus ventricosus]
MRQTPEDTKIATAGVSAAAGRPISRQTVSRRLREVGLFARRPVVCVPLSPAQVRARLHWASEHRSWTPEQWGYVLFTDEFRFNMQNDSRRAIIWRVPETRYLGPNIGERDHYRGGGLLVWAGDSNERPNRPLRVCRGFRHSSPISRRNPTPSCAAFYHCKGYRRDIYGR